MATPENDFKHKYLKKIRDIGAFAQSLETNVPGFPDTIIDWGFPCLVEFKWFDEKDLNQRAIKLFTKYQKPWMNSYVNRIEYQGNVYIVFGSKEFNYYIRMTNGTLWDLSELTLRDFIKECSILSNYSFKITKISLA